MKRIIEPQENVEYVFRFPPKKVYAYRWYGDIQKGRILLFNITRKYYTAMTPVYFTFLCSNRLVSKTIVQPNDKPIIEEPKPTASPSPTAEVKPKKQKEEDFDYDTVKPLEPEITEWLQGELIPKLNAIPEKDKQYIRRKYEEFPVYWIEKTIARMQAAIKDGCSNAEFASIMGAMNKAENDIMNLHSRLGACI